jgi:hypothetical protein
MIVNIVNTLTSPIKQPRQETLTYLFFDREFMCPPVLLNPCLYLKVFLVTNLCQILRVRR